MRSNKPPDRRWQSRATSPTGPGKKKNKNRPLRLELEPATRLMHRAIVARKPYYAFPKSLVAVVRLGRLLPPAIYDRLLEGRGPRRNAPMRTNGRT
jgi:hypothetical protein